jgi:magnesium transporter
VTVRNRNDLALLRPIWVDLVDPPAEVRFWVGEFFGLDLPDPESLTDLESSARFYVDDSGEVHLHSDFLLDSVGQAQNVAVALILHRDILFSVRKEELPVFRLQRLRARTQPGYVTSTRPTPSRTCTPNSRRAAGACSIRRSRTIRRHASWPRLRAAKT